jgi:hypothetical protein
MDELYITNCFIESITETHYGKKDLSLLTTVDFFCSF